METIEQDIFHRQRLITNWEQERLAQARVAIVGSDWLAGYCALCLACLGVGRIYLLDNARAEEGERFFFPLERGDSRTQGWANWLTDLGFPNQIIARRTNPVYGSHVLLPPVDVIVSATNDSESQQALVHHAVQHGIPLATGAANRYAGMCTVVSDQSRIINHQSPITITNHQSSPQGALPSAIIAALMVEEVRRFLLPLPNDCTLSPGSVLHYNPSHPHRFALLDNQFSHSPTLPLSYPVSQFPSFPICYFPLHRVLLVGAGALGTFAAIGLAMRGDIGSLTVVDHDYVEATNLNRQPLYLRSVGEGKAITLAKQLRKICPTMQVDYIAEAICVEHFDHCHPDLVLSCVDSFAPRKLLHDECLRRGIPLINGGTSAFSGHLEVYHPGKTACFNCLYALDDLAAREEHERADPARCPRAVEPSVVTTNALIGGVMAAEAGCSLNPEFWGEPLRWVLHYDAHAPQRMKNGFSRRPCGCGVKVERSCL